MDDTIIIAPGFNGPRLSGNGGYVGGVLAERYTQTFGGDGTVEITLRAPIPIDRDAAGRARRRGADAARRRHAGLRGARRLGRRISSRRRRPTDWAEVMRRGEEGGSPPDSDFRRCIVCGRGRAVGDGLRVLGTPGRSRAIRCPATCRTPTMPTPTGRIRPEFVWGTLDCPGAFAAQDPDDLRPALTGRMTAKVIEPPKVGERCAVVGWRIGAEGRKLYSGTALYTESGRLCALGTCTWIVLRPSE